MKSKSKIPLQLKSGFLDRMKSKTTNVLKNLKMRKMHCLAYKKTQKEKVFCQLIKKDLIQNAEISTDVPSQSMNMKRTKALTKRSITQ